MFHRYGGNKMRTVMTVAVFLLMPLAPSLARDIERPNIIFLMADDQATISMGCYGNKEARTPNMDRLAEAGIRFNRHYDTTAICMASRATVMTGLYEYRHGCNFDHGPMHKNHFLKTYPVLLREAGYLTAFAGKFGFDVGGIKFNDIAGYFDAWGGGPGQTSYATGKNKSMAKYAKKYPHSTLSYGAFGQDFIKESVKKGKPFCLSISFKAPHRPTTPDPKFKDVYKGKAFTKPVNFGRDKGLHFAPQSRMGRQYPRFIEWGYRDRYDEVMAIYNQQVYGIDVAVGMIVEEVQRQKVDDRTVIIYTSDNGFLCGSHGYGSKVLPYEESTRVPLIISDPRQKETAGKTSNALSGNVDIAPTILDLAGVALPEGLDGKSLVPVLSDPQKEVRDELALMNMWGPTATHYLSVVSGKWKYTFWPYEKGEMKAFEELMDTQGDPFELKNHAKSPEHAKALETMRAQYDLRMKHVKEHVVPYNKYGHYGTFFDRQRGTQEKQEATGKKSRGKQRKKK